MEKNNYIQEKGLRTIFIASVLISAINQANVLVDGIIVSHFISPDALSAINMSSPVTTLLNMVVSVLCSGASILVTREMGMQHYSNVKRIFTVSLFTAIATNVIFACCLAPCAYSIADLLTDDNRLLPYIGPYLQMSIIGSIGIILQILLTTFVNITGKPHLVTKVTLLEFAANILLDLLLVGVFDLGVMGAALATALSCLGSCIVVVPLMRKDDSLLTVEQPKASWFIPWQKYTVENGFTSAIETICLTILFLGLNTIVVRSNGADGMFILTVSTQIIMVSMLVLQCADQSITNIGGVLIGERNVDAYRNLMRSLYKKSIIGIAVITLILMITPDIIAQFFGAKGDMLEEARNPLRIMCLLLPPLCVVRINNSSLSLLSHSYLFSSLNVFLMAFVIISGWVSSIYFPDYIWVALTSSVWLLMAIMIFCTFILSRRNRTLNWFSLIPMLPNDPSVSYSIAYNEEAVQNALNNIRIFIDVCDLPHEISYKIESCIEELTYNLLSMTNATGKKGAFDLRVVDTGEKIMIAMKDDGEPYNPILQFKTDGERSYEEENLALLMINGLCPDINYKYMNGINCVYMNFKYKE